MHDKITKEKINLTKLNEVIILSNRILKIAFLFLLVLGIYALIMVLKELKIIIFLLNIMRILSPVFIGLFIAWLLAPLVLYLNKRGLNRIISTTIVYLLMLSILYLIITGLFPLLLNQINDFFRVLPTTLDATSEWLNSFLLRFQMVTIIDIEVIKNDIINYINNIIKSLTTDIPERTIIFIKGLFSVIWVFALGLIIGFYLLFDFQNIGRSFLLLFPPNIKTNLKLLYVKINYSLFSYIKGILLLSSIIFILSTISLSIIGLKAPILLGLIIGITDIIPYIGPYLGAFPVVIIAFIQGGFSVGVLTMIVLTIIQLIEGNFFHPFVMSKTMKLHPVSIIIGILLFGYFFGIIGMIIATPIVALIKTLVIFLDEKYNIIYIKNKKIR